jgi:hypothetical protein
MQNRRWFTTLMLLVGGLQAQDVSGLWVGQYKYQATDENELHVFSVVLHQDGTVVSGKVIEENDFGNKSWKYLSADVVGEVEGERIVLYKKYDGTGLQNHVVVYRGRITEKKMTGDWSIGATTGPFEMKLVDAAEFPATTDKTGPGKF